MKTLSAKALPLSLAVVSMMNIASANTEPNVQLDAMTIKSDRQGTKVLTNVVTLQEKDESTATGLRELLKSDPSVDFGAGNGASQYISIRGMGQNSIDVKIDNAYNDSQILYHQGRHMLDPSLVKIVSVQKGAGSASAGIGATNGAIVAKTVDAYDLLKDGQNLGFKVGAGYSSNDEHSYNATIYGKAGVFDFLLAGNRVDQDNYKAGDGYVSPVDRSDTVHYQALDKTSYLAKAGVTLNNHRFVLSHLNETNKGTRNVREEFDWFERQAPEYREYTLAQTNLEWQGKNLGFNTDVTANIYMMENKRESAGGEQYGNPGVRGLTLAQNETVVETKGANLNFDTRVHDDVLLKYGLNYRHQEITPNYQRKATDIVNFGNAQNPDWRPFGIDLVNQEKVDTGAYVEVIGDIGDVTATAGIRYDHFKYKAMDGKEVSNDSLNPSIGLIWQATPQLSFNANHNYATRSPRLVDALLSGNRNYSIASGIKAEKAQNTEIGFNYNNGNLALDGSYYWQQIDDLLTRGQVARHDVTGSYYTALSNVGYAKNQGWELNGRYRFNNLTARLGVAESEPEFFSEPDAQGNLPSFSNREFAVNLGRTWTAGLAYRFDNPNLEIGVNHRYTEEAKGSTWKNNPKYNANATRDSYNTTDIYVNWKPFGTDRMNVNFAVNNVTDEYYVPQTLANIGVPGVGREFRIGVNFTY